jgi:hypothetical protein
MAEFEAVKALNVRKVLADILIGLVCDSLTLCSWWFASAASVPPLPPLSL